MLHSEFTKLAGFQVEENYYHCVIEPEYNRSTLDKAEWVKQWKKYGGIQKAYDAQVSRYEDKAGEVERLQEMNDNQIKIVREARQESYDYREKFEAVKEQLYDAKQKISEDAKCKETDAYELLEISEKYSCVELRSKVIEMIGFRAYIQYKFDHDMAIRQIDRDEIMKHI